MNVVAYMTIVTIVSSFGLLKMIYCLEQSYNSYSVCHLYFIMGKEILLLFFSIVFYDIRNLKATCKSKHYSRLWLGG